MHHFQRTYSTSDESNTIKPSSFDMVVVKGSRDVVNEAQRNRVSPVADPWQIRGSTLSQWNLDFSKH